MVCVTCKAIYRPERNGIYVEEMMPLGVPDDKDLPETKWVPYKLWVGDLLKCPKCGHQVVAGIPIMPLVEHYMAAYKGMVADAEARGKLVCQVEDCGPLQLGDRYLSSKNSETAALRSALRDAKMQLGQIKASLDEAYETVMSISTVEDGEET